MVSVTPISAFDSNYFWVIRPQEQEPWVYLVDPGCASPVLAYLNQNQLKLAAILVTHRHRDHIGGIDELLALYPVSVYGPDSSAIPQVTHKLYGGDAIELGGLTFQVMAVPGHTREHIAYYLPRINTPDNPERLYRGDFAKEAGAHQAPAVFSGDTLFAGGCGRLFDGPAEALWASLNSLAALPEDTRVYCAHEYTLANLLFAHHVEPDNLLISQRLAEVQSVRAAHQNTLPSSILIEKQTNPFLRCQQPVVKNFIEHSMQQKVSTAAEVFAALRHIKDTWQPA